MAAKRSAYKRSIPPVPTYSAESKDSMAPERSSGIIYGVSDDADAITNQIAN